MSAPENQARSVTGDSWGQREEVIQNFESAWQQGRRPAIEDHLPPAGPARRAALTELVHVELECRLKVGEAARVEEYLQRYPELAGDAGWVLDLIAAEHKFRRSREPGLAPAEYLKRFPRYQAELAARLRPPRPPAAAAPADPAAFAAALRDSRLLEPAHLDELARLQKPFPEARALARELVRRGWLTPFQVNELFQGRGQDLVLGPYVLLERLGKGGMGQVFKARHRLMNRTVALKIIRKEFLAHGEAAQRFRREIQAAAQLSHPNIVIAHDAEQLGETHFLVMEFIEGSDLAKLVKQRGPLPVAQACDYVRQAALGLQHAHQRGLVHRDIKPSNLFVTARGGVVKVLDMGLARLERVGETGTATAPLTELGAVMGTPDYIAPEQALDTREADHRADVYSLGCTLYHLLTGRPPFPGGSLAQKLLWHQQAEPEPVERLRPDLPQGLALVLRKMMAKHPGDRYQTAAEVAGALELFCRYATPLAGVRPGGAVGESQPAAPVTPPPPSPWADTLGGAAADSVPTAPDRAPPGPAGRRRWRRVGLAAGAAVLLALAGWLVVRGWDGRAGGWWFGSWNRPALVIPPDNRLGWQPPEELMAVLGEDRAHHWGPVRCLAVSPDGKLAASGGDDHMIRVWDTATMTGKVVLTGHTGPVVCLAFSPDGHTLLSGSEDWTAHLWDVDSGKELRQFAGHQTGVYGVAFTPDGATAITDSSGLRTWEVKSGRMVTAGDGNGNRAYFAPDGVRFARLGPDGLLYVWESPTQQPPPRGLDLIGTLARAKPLEPRPGLITLAVSADGRSILTFTTDRILRLWDADGKEVRQLGGPADVLALAFSPDGKKALSVGNDLIVHLWDVEAGRELRRLEGQAAGIAGPGTATPVFLPDGRQALTAASDGTVRLWDLDTGKELHPVKGHTAPVQAVAFAPDGRSLLSGGLDRVGRLWDLRTGTEVRHFEGHGGWVTSTALSPGGRQALTGSNDGTMRLWNTDTGEALLTCSQVTGNVVAFAPQGARALAATQRPAPGWGAVLVNLDNGREVATLGGLLAPAQSAAFSPDGGRVLLGGGDYLLRLYEAETGKELRRYPGHTDAVLCVSFAADGRHFLSVSADKTVRLWEVDAETCTQRALLQDYPAAVSSVAIAANGKTVAASSTDGRVVVWETTSGRKLVDWKLPGPVYRVAFAPDGRQLATANANGTVYLFRAPQPEERAAK